MKVDRYSCSLSVIIPVHNGGENFRKCLLSLANSDVVPAEVIVVADGDTDGSGDLAEAHGARVFRFSSAGGPARARNCGAKLAQGDILFFIDADVEVHPTTIGQVIAAFQSDRQLTALIGSYDDRPGDPGFLSQYRNLLHHYVHQTGRREAFTFWGACGAIQREAFQAVGGFDERYIRPCIEDIELGYRLRQAGYKIELHREIQVKHLKRWGAASMMWADVFYRAIPWATLILRAGKMDSDLNLQHSNRLSVVLAFGVLLGLVGAIWLPPFLVFAIAAFLGLIALNFSLYRFFQTKRGLLFCLCVIPWHWLFYFYSGVAFAIALGRYWLQPTYRGSSQVS